jgi:hypothetical protein
MPYGSSDQEVVYIGKEMTRQRYYQILQQLKQYGARALLQNFRQKNEELFHE